MKKKHGGARERYRLRHKGRRRVPKAGAPPGLVTVDPEAQLSSTSIIQYGPDFFSEQPVEAFGQIGDPRGDQPVTWIDVDGLGDEAILRQLAQRYGIHRLTMEDVVNLGQRAKVEAYDEYLFVVVHLPLGLGPTFEQVSLVIGSDFVLTFQETGADCFDRVRSRLREGQGRIRKNGADYLAYALIDAVVDSYFPVLDALGEELYSIEERILSGVGSNDTGELHESKGKLLELRRIILPHVQAISALLGQEELIGANTRIHLRDCYDHALRASELAETLREISSDLMTTHLSIVSHRMNEVMRVLTIIATIFIPLSFIAGIYGMNFDPSVSPVNMPELSWYWGYPFALGLMLATMAAMLFFFWRRGWFR
ncbi:MAG: magnesium/cobalt transporter CorA [Thermoanaerobaculia bacterium]